MTERVIRVESLAGINAACAAVMRSLEALVKSGQGAEVVVRQKRRSRPQNDKLQAMCRRLATTAKWHGQALTNDEWRHLFVSGVLGAKVIPSLNGGFLSLIRSSKDLSEEKASECIETIYAWCAEHGHNILEDV